MSEVYLSEVVVLNDLPRLLPCLALRLAEPEHAPNTEPYSTTPGKMRVAVVSAILALLVALSADAKTTKWGKAPARVTRSLTFSAQSRAQAAPRRGVQDPVQLCHGKRRAAAKVHRAARGDVGGGFGRARRAAHELHERAVLWRDRHR